MFTPFRSRRRVLGWAASLTAMSMLHSAWAARNVQVDRVVRGTASFAASGSLTTITASNHAIINYKQFNIANGETVRFVQPSSVSRVLNRIKSNAPSLLDGSLFANGIVYFVNPAGVMFGPHSIISVGGIIAAAGNITDNDFSNNVDHFSGTGALVNNGTINAGSAQLVGQSVTNHGVINAPGGLIAMVAGQDVMLGTSSSNILVKIGTANSQGGVSNDGTINAAGGQASLVSGDIYSMALGTPSVIKANQVSVQGGSVAVSGKIDATNSAGNGGSVAITGQTVSVQSASIDASGATGGGTVLIGGNFHGAGPLPNAQSTSVSADSVIRADAVTSGNGGQVAIWSEAVTTFAGTILARAAAAGGAGGYAEVSSRQSLNFNPTKIDLGGGQLLLDPASITIVDNTGAADINGDGTPGNDITGADDLSDATADYPGAGSIISSTALNTVLAGSFVTLAATDCITDDAIATPVHVPSGITLTLDAPMINLSGPINVDSGGALAGGPKVLVANVHSGGLIQNGIDVFSALGAAYPVVNIYGGSYAEDVNVRQGDKDDPISLVALMPVTVNSLTVSESSPAYFNGTFTATNGFTINEAIHAGFPNASLGAGQNATLIGPMTVANDGGGASDGSIDANDLTFTIITDSLTMSPLAQIDNNFSGEGTAVIQPETDSTPIFIGDTTPPPGTGLKIDPLDNIGPNLALVIIGSPIGFGAISINNPGDNSSTSTFFSPVTIQSPGGSISINGQYLKGAFTNLGALILNAPTIAINAPIIMPYQQCTVEVGQIGNPAAITLAADITTAYSTVTFTGAVTLGADASIDTTSGNQTTGPAAVGASVSFSSTVAGAGHGLTVNAGNLGTISFAGDVDNVANLTITNSDGATFGGTLGAGTAGNVTISDSQNAAVILFDGAANILTLTASGASPSYVIDFNAASGGQSSSVVTASLSNSSGISFGNDTGDSISFTNGLNYQAGTTQAIGTVSTNGTADIDLAATTFTGNTTFTAGITTFHGAVTGDEAIIINGNAAFDSTLATLTSLHVTGNTSMTPASLTTAGAQAYDGDLTLFGGMAESFTASSFSVGGTLTGDGHDVTINTSATFHAITGVSALQINGDGTFDGIVSADSVTVTGATTAAAGTIATTGDQNYQGILTLTGDTTFASSGSGAINFDGAVDSGSTPYSLTTDTAGTATFKADIGDMHPLANLYSAPGGTVVFGDGGMSSMIAISTVTTSPNGQITLNNGVTLAAGATITARAVDFAGPLDTDGVTPRTLEVNGNAAFNGAVSVGSITVTGATTTSAGTITTSGDQDYQGAVTLDADSSFISSGGGNLTFASTIDSSSSMAVSLLTETSGLALFEGNIGGAYPLSNFQTAPFGSAQLGGGSGNMSLSVNPAGEILFNYPVTLAANVTMNAGTVIFSNSLDSDSSATPRDLTITAAPGMLTFDGLFTAESLTAGAADVTFNATGQTHELGNVIINPSSVSSAYVIDLNAGAYNYNNVTFTSPVILTADTVITATGNVDFQSTLDSDSNSSARALAINTSGLIIFAGDVGNTAALSSITTGSAGSTDINAATVIVSGSASAQTYQNPVSLSASTRLEGGSITFDSTVTGNSFDLTLAAIGSRFSGTVSGVGNLNVSDIASIAANISTTGSQTYSTITLLADVSLTGQGISAANIGSSGITSYALTLNAGSGAISVTGSTEGLSLLTISNSSSTTFAGGIGLAAFPMPVTITNTAGAVAFEGDTYIATLTTTANPYAVAFTGATTTIGTATTFNNTGGVTLGGSGSSVTLFTGGLTNTAGSTTAAGSVSTAGAPLVFAALNLSGDTTLDTTNAGAAASGAAITIASIAGNSHNLILTPGSSIISVTGNTDAVALLTITNSGGATFGGTFDSTTAGAVTISDTAAGDTVAFDGSANITTFSAAATANAYNISFNAGTGGQTSVITTANIANTGSLTLGNDPADRITFTNGFSSTNPAISLSGTLAATNNPITLGGITIANNATIAAGSAGISATAVTIDAGATLNLGVGGSGSITLASVSGASAANLSNLAFNTTGAVSVTGTVGPNIGNLTITNSGGATFGGTVTANAVTFTSTTGTIAFDNSLSAATLTDVGGSFDVEFLGATSITNAVALGTTGTVTFGSGGTALAFVGGVAHTAGPDVLDGDLTSSNAAIDIDLQVTGNSTIDAGTAGIILGDTALSSGVILILGTGSSGPITVASVAGTSTSGLVIDTTGAVNIAGAIGSSASPVESLTVTAGPATFGDAINTAGDISITANDSGSGSSFVPGDLVFHGNLTAGGNMTLQPGTTLVPISGVAGAYSGSTITFYNNTITAGGNVSLVPSGDVVAGFGGEQVTPASVVNAVPSNANIIGLGVPVSVNGFTNIALNIQAANFTMGASANLLAVTGGVNISVSSGTSTFSTIEALGSINITAASGTTLDLVSRGSWVALGVGGQPVSETGIIFFAGGVGQPDILSTPDNFPTDNLTKYALSFATAKAGSGTAITLNPNQLLTAADALVTVNGSQYYLAGPIANAKPAPPVTEFFGALIPMVDQQIIQENIIFDSAMRKQFWRLGLYGRDITLDTIDGDGFRAPDADQAQWQQAMSSTTLHQP